MAPLSFPPTAKHAMGRLSQASIPVPEIPRSLGSALSHHRPLSRGWGCRGSQAGSTTPSVTLGTALAGLGLLMALGMRLQEL